MRTKGSDDGKQKPRVVHTIMYRLLLLGCFTHLFRFCTDYVPETNGTSVIPLCIRKNNGTHCNRLFLCISDRYA